MVLDLTQRIGNYCGKLFADLGANVVLVEPIDGSYGRRTPPFVEDKEDPALSLDFFYKNTSKRSIAIDLSRPSGREVVRELAGRSDLVIEDRSPGELQNHGLGANDLLEKRPSLVVTSITPFGQEGPYAQYAHADIVALALGGLLWLGGYADGPPVAAAGEQAFMAGSLFGAVASMVALTHAEMTGVGQHVDVSVQEAVAMGLENAVQFYDLEGTVRRRFGGKQKQAGFGVFPCNDGHIFVLAGGIGGNRFWGNLVEWLRSAGVEGADALDGPQWGDRDYIVTEEAKELFAKVFGHFALGATKSDLYHEAQYWRVPVCPVNRPSDLVRSQQLVSRRFFAEIEWGDRTIALPGAPYRLSGTPWEIGRPSPALGEHSDEILRQIGMGSSIDELRSKGVIR